MDFIMDWRLIYCLRNGYPLDQSVYDAAAWSCIVEFERTFCPEQELALWLFPDFTRGAWRDYKPGL